MNNNKNTNIFTLTKTPFFSPTIKTHIYSTLQRTILFTTDGVTLIILFIVQSKTARNKVEEN